VLRDGRYQRTTAEEADILDGDTTGVAIKSALASLQGFAHLAATAELAPVTGLPTDRGGQFRKMVQDQIGEAGQHLARSAQMNELRPDAADKVTGVTNVLDIMTGGLFVPGRKAGAEVAQTAAERVAARITEQAADSPGFGPTSAGAAQVGPVKPIGKLYRAITDRLSNGPQLNADQFDILETKLWEQVGFEFPPGSLDDPGLFASYLSNPFTRQVIEPYLVENSAKLGNKFIRALGLSPDDYPRGFSRGVLSAARKKQGQGFKQIGEMIEGPIDVGFLDDALRAQLSRADRELLEETGGLLPGPQAMTVRSHLNTRMAKAWGNPDQTLALKLEEAVADMDGLITQGLGKDGVKQWRKLQEQWRTRMTLDRPGTIDAKGNLSLKNLNRNLERQYRDFAESAPSQLDEIPLVMNETRELLKFSRVARSFEDSISDSGTATRSTLQTLATNPKFAFVSKGLAHALEDGSRTPAEALRAMQ